MRPAVRFIHKSQRHCRRGWCQRWTLPSHSTRHLTFTQSWTRPGLPVPRFVPRRHESPLTPKPHTVTHTHRFGSSGRGGSRGQSNGSAFDCESQSARIRTETGLTGLPEQNRPETPSASSMPHLAFTPSIQRCEPVRVAGGASSGVAPCEVAWMSLSMAIQWIRNRATCGGNLRETASGGANGS